MLKGGCLHPQMASVMAELGHMDTIMVCDAGLPIPPEVERIDLAWKPHEPAYLPVLEELLRNIVVEKAYLANELKMVSPQMHEEILKLLPQGLAIEYLPHIKLKELSRQTNAIIRTGEFTPYSSVILVAGCAY